MARLQQLITELRRRRIFRTAGMYVVAAWVFVQVASLIFPAINVPESALLYVWMATLLVFPLTIIFSWRYNLTATGLTRTPPAQTNEQFDPSLRRTDIVILALLSFVAISITWQLSTRIESAVEFTGSDVNPNSIAVLPLDNISGNPEQQYFASGMQASLIAGLARIRMLRVTSKTSTMRYRDSGDTLPDIGRQLGVAKIIEGSVYRFKNRVRLEIQLLDAKADEHIWSATFEDDIEDVLLLQSKAAQAIAGQVRVTLSHAEQALFNDTSSVNPAAYEAFLKGQFHVERFTPEDMQLAAKYYQQAVQLDPDFALGHWGLSKLCGFQAQAGLITPEDARDRCLEPNLRALDLDPSLPEAHLGYASHLTWQQFDWERADAEFERAIELNPSYAEAHMFYSHYLAIVGRLDKSSAHMQLALELDPLNPFVRALYGIQLVIIDDFETAIAIVEDVLSSTPGIGFGYSALWMSYNQLNENDKALSAASQYFRKTKGNPIAADALEAIYDGTNYAEAMLHAANALVAYRKTAHVSLADIGLLFEHAAEFETAIDWHEEAFRMGGPDAPYMGALSKISAVNENPRYHQLLRDMKLDYWADKFSNTEF